MPIPYQISRVPIEYGNESRNTTVPDVSLAFEDTIRNSFPLFPIDVSSNDGLVVIDALCCLPDFVGWLCCNEGKVLLSQLSQGRFPPRLGRRWAGCRSFALHLLLPSLLILLLSPFHPPLFP